MKKILILIGCLLFLACSKRVVPTSDRILIDSTVVSKTVKERDTTIVVPASSSVLKLPVSELKTKPIVKKQGQATLSLSKENDIIIAIANCDELELRLKLKDSLIKILKAKIDSTTYHAPRDDTGNWYDGVKDFRAWSYNDSNHCRSLHLYINTILKTMKKTANGILADNPEENVVFMTEDGQGFFDLLKATNHANKNEFSEPEAFYRAVL